ncbi:MAG TPA: hypothetical protein RMH99_13360 [Sandaracinaceae bacterium LLY-WYZ-13_1]|nr:hypothetical protein [Sandaracinaceae bacterium LLY-WYZ-13_1]
MVSIQRIWRGAAIPLAPGDPFLRSLDGAVDVDPDGGALELRLSHDLERYDDTAHESLDGDTPRARWEADSRPRRFDWDEAQRRSRFVVTEERRVGNDHVIEFDGGRSEAPRARGRSRATRPVALPECPSAGAATRAVHRRAHPASVPVLARRAPGWRANSRSHP